MMKKLICITLLLCTLSLTACTRVFNFQTVRGSGNIVTESRDVSGFSAIALDGIGNVTVEVADEESLTIEAEDNIIENMTFEVRGSTLHIGSKPNTNLNPTEPVEIVVTMMELEALEINGSGNITAENILAEEFQAVLRGSGTIITSGSADSVDIQLDGSGNIYCKDLLSAMAKVKINGSGNVTVYASEQIDIGISGSGNVVYSGDPANVQKSVTGSGTIEAED